MTSFGGSGGSGVARGRITVDLSGLMTARSSLIQATQQMDRALAQVGTKGTANLNRFNQTLDRTLGSLQKVRGALLGVSAVGAALTGLGLKAADNIRLLEIRFRELTGSEAAAKKLMDQIADGAERAGLSVRQTQSAFAGLVPAIREANGDVDEYIGLVARLATLNRSEGVEGATFAIREALTSGGTDLVSLAERFNIPRRALRELIEETGSFSKALDQLLNEQGATSEAAEAAADSLSGAMTRFRDATSQAFERAFLPFLNTATSLVNTFGNALKSVPSIVLNIGAGFTVAATAVATFGLGLERALATSKALKEAQLFGGRGGTAVARLGVGAAALYGGAQIGAEVARRLPGQEGQSRQDIFKDVGETFKRLIVILTEGFERGSRAIIGGLQKVAEIFLTGRIVLRNAFENIGEGLRQVPPLIIGMFENMIGEVIGLFAGLMESVVDALDDLPLISGGAFRGGSEGLRDVASGLQSRGQERRDMAAGTIGQLLAPTTDETTAIALQLENTFGGVNTALDGMTESMYDLLFPAQEVEEAVNPLEAVFQNMANRFQRMGENVRRFREIQQEVLSELAEEQARIDADRERDALRDQEDFARQRIQSLEDFHRQQARSEADFYRNRERSIADFNRENAEAVTDFERDRLEAQQEFARQSADAAEDHERKLQRIARDGREAVLDAASRLDARGVAQAMRSTERRMRDERDEFARERAERQRDMQERLTEQQQNFAEQRSQRVENFQRQLADQQENFDRSRAQQLEDFNLRIQRENDERAIRAQRQAEDFAREDAMRQAEAQKRINDLLQEANLQRSIIGNMLSAWTSGLQAAANYAINFVSRLRQMFQNTSVSRAARSFGSGVSNAVSGVGTVLSNSGFGATVNAISSIGSAAAGALGGLLGFQTGGVARGSGLAMVHDKERVLSPAQTASFDRLVAAMEGGGGAGMTINAEININGDTGGRSDSDFKRLFYESMDDLLTRAERSSGKGTR